MWEEYGGLSKKTLVLGLGLSVLGALLVYDCATSSCDNGFDFGDDNYQDFTGVMMLGVGIPMSLMALSDVGNTSLRLTPAGRRAQETRRAAREAERERQQGHLRRRLVEHLASLDDDEFVDAYLRLANGLQVAVDAGRGDVCIGLAGFDARFSFQPPLLTGDGSPPLHFLSQILNASLDARNREVSARFRGEGETALLLVQLALSRWASEANRERFLFRVLSATTQEYERQQEEVARVEDELIEAMNAASDQFGTGRFFTLLGYFSCAG